MPLVPTNGQAKVGSSVCNELAAHGLTNYKASVQVSPRPSPGANFEAITHIERGFGKSIIWLISLCSGLMFLLITLLNTTK